MKKIENLKWSPNWVSHLGCVKGCLDYLGIEMSDGWLIGGTGHAFIINIGEDICPSGPTAWKTMMLFEQGNRLGYEFDSVFGFKHMVEDFEALQQKAWDFTRESIDKGIPVYGWEFAVAEYYVVYGYDENGYYYSGPEADDGRGPMPWQKLGTSDIGLIEMYRVFPRQPDEDIEVVRTALEQAVKHASNPEEWIFENYGSGLKGFDNWIKGLESGIAGRFGMGYNAAVWATCRKYAVEFLLEAEERLGGKASDLFKEGVSHYQVVADRLANVSKTYPWIPSIGPPIIPVDEKCMEAVGWLREAREAEAAGLEVLDNLAEVLR